MNDSRRAIFFDRDGVVNRRLIGDYVKRTEEFDFIPDVFEVLPDVHRNGYLAILVTNQRGIARGLMTEDDLTAVHRFMQEELKATCGATFDAIYYCPHNHNDGCDCRKPGPGMLLQAGRDLDLDLTASWMIGDTESDVMAGHAAGCRAARIADAAVESTADIVGPGLLDVWRRIKAAEKSERLEVRS